MFNRPAKTFSPGAIIRRLWSFVPHGGALPENVWLSRHRFLTALTWLHALVIAAIGPIAGYSWELSAGALWRDGTVLHTALAGALVALFALIGSSSFGSRALRASAVSFGLMSASAILVHLSGGYIEFHFHFFLMLVFLALYQGRIPYILAIAYVGIHHGLVGALWPEEVFNHAAAINAPGYRRRRSAFFSKNIGRAPAARRPRTREPVLDSSSARRSSRPTVAQSR